MSRGRGAPDGGGDRRTLGGVRTFPIFALAAAVFPIGNVAESAAVLYGIFALAWVVLTWRDARHGLLFVAGPVLAAVGLLPLVPLVIRWWLRRRVMAIRYSDLSTLDKLPTGRARIANFISVFLRAAVLVTIVFALARPQVPDGSTRLPSEGIAIAFACDVSGSMAETDYEWTASEVPIARLDAARRSFGLFVAGGTSGVYVPRSP